MKKVLRPDRVPAIGDEEFGDQAYAILVLVWISHHTAGFDWLTRLHKNMRKIDPGKERQLHLGGCCGKSPTGEIR